MNPALWGSLCAVNLGVADFLARFSSRALGHVNALLGVLVVGSMVLSLWALRAPSALVWEPSGLWLLALNGTATTVMTLLLYRGLARGPVSVVAPIVASHPVLVVALWFALGIRPSWIQWAAMATTLAGVIIVARCAENPESGSEWGPKALRKTIAIAAAAAVAYAVLVAAGQVAVPIYGEFQTLWLGRLVSLAFLLVLLLVRGQHPNLPLRWWPFLTAQGALDAGGYLSLLSGSKGQGAEIAAVTASTFAAVTTLMARFLLREPIRSLQWCGIVLIFAGVAVLTAYQ